MAEAWEKIYCTDGQSRQANSSRPASGALYINIFMFSGATCCHLKHWMEEKSYSWFMTNVLACWESSSSLLFLFYFQRSKRCESLYAKLFFFFIVVRNQCDVYCTSRDCRWWSRDERRWRVQPSVVANLTVNGDFSRYQTLCCSWRLLVRISTARFPD